MICFYVDQNSVSNILIEATTSYMKQELILSSTIHYMVGFTHSLRIKSILNPKVKENPFSGEGVFMTVTVGTTDRAEHAFPTPDISGIILLRGLL